MMPPVNSPYLSRAAASLHLPMPGQTPVTPAAFPKQPDMSAPPPLQQPSNLNAKADDWVGGYKGLMDRFRQYAAAKEGPAANFPDRFGTSGSPQLPYSGPVSTPATGAPNWPSPVMPAPPAPAPTPRPDEVMASGNAGPGPGALSNVPAAAGPPAGYNPNIPNMANLAQSQDAFGPGMRARTVPDGNGGMMNDFYGPGAGGPSSIPDWLRSKFSGA